MRDRKHFWLKILILAAAVTAAFFYSFFVGRYPVTPETVFDIIRSHFMPVEQYWEGTLAKVVMEVRLPRILAAIFVGGALSVSGASYQTMFKNPMVSPDLLGVSAGASFGAALVMLSHGFWWQIQSNAFIFGIGAVLAAYLISRVLGKNNITVLVLSGVVVSSFFQAMLSIVKTLADTDDALPSITFWLMGSLGKVKLEDLRLLIPMTLIALFLLFMFRHQINTMAAGENEATSMGVNVPLVKVIVVSASTIMTVVSVSLCGIIGWVGLVVPHICRALVGASYGKLIASSFLTGGLFLLIVDNMIRGTMAVDLPLGVMTSLIGTPVFVALLVRSRKEWH